MLFKRAVKRTLRNKINKKAKNKKRQSELKAINTTINIKKYFFHSLKIQHNIEDHWEIHSIVLDKQDLLAKMEILPQKHRLYNILCKPLKIPSIVI